MKPEIVTNNANTEKLENNVITVGGPKWNKVTEKLLGEMGSPLYYKVGESGLIKEVPEIGKDVLTYEKNNGEAVDYGCWIFERGDKNKGSRLIISGYSTWGVLIAAEALHRLEDIDDYSFLKRKLKKEKRSEEHTSELQSHSFISYAVFCLKKKKKNNKIIKDHLKKQLKIPV